MAGNSLSLVWDLIARDGASPTFTKVGAAADKAAASTESAATKTEAASSRINAAMKTVGVVAVAGVVALGVESLKAAANFQSSTTRLVTSANEQQKNLKMVQKGILDLSGQVGDSASSLSAAMYKVESGGQHGAAGLTVLKAAAQGAKAENADLTTVADALTSVLQDYHLQASASADVTSKLVAATASGKMTFEELAASLSAILPIASANHVSLNDILGDLASMTVHGMSAEQASQNLADAVRHLAAPTQQSTKELAALGISATQVAANLGAKGLSGTMQEIATTIQQKIGPGSTQIILNLNDALAKLPKPVQDFAKGLLSGANTVGDFRAEIKALPPDQAAALQSFESLITSTHQVGAETKSAAQVYQSYSGALRLALGDATSMNVALMLTGENSHTTTTAIQNVSKATADAQGNVRGWSEIQGTFNVQMQELGQHIEADAISLGMKMLPAATSVASTLNRDLFPALRTVGSGASDVLHWFEELPAPIRDVTLGLGALKLATAFNFLGITSGASTLKTTFAGLREEIALQQTLWTMNQRSVMDAGRTYGGMERALGGFGVGASEAAAGASRLEGTLGTLAARGMAGVKAAGSGLISMFGGPWGVALVAGGLAVAGLVHWLQESNTVIPKVKVNTDSLTAAIQANNGAIDQNVRKQAAMALQQAGLFKAANQWGISLSTLTDAALGNKTAIEQVAAAAQAYKQKQDAAAAATANGSYQSGIAGDAYKKAAMQSDEWWKSLQSTIGTVNTTIGQQKQLTEAVGTSTSAVKGLQTVIDGLHGNTVTITVNADHTAGVLLGSSGMISRPGFKVGYADGGAIRGPGTGTSDSVLIAASNGEHMWTASEVAAAGGHSAVEAMRKSVLANGRGFAAGGPIIAANVNEGPFVSAVQSMAKQMSQVFAPGAPGNVSANAALAQQMAAAYGWGSGAEWNALYSVGKRESGWNNLAQNPTSTAYGIPQFLDSTWATVGLSKTSNPVIQIAGMLKYIQQRYRDPLGAWAHEMSAGWYDGGGWLPPGATMALNGTGKPERIRTAEQESALQRQLSGPTQITLQLDGAAVTDLLDGRIVTFADVALNRGAY